MVRSFTVRFREDQGPASLNTPQRRRQEELSNWQTDRDWDHAWWTLPPTPPPDIRDHHLQPPVLLVGFKWYQKFWLRFLLSCGKSETQALLVGLMHSLYKDFGFEAVFV